MNLNNLKISEHAKERYSERVMEKQGKNAIVAYAATHADKILEDIRKMIGYGKCIYTGKSIQDNKANYNCSVILSGTWILICNEDTDKVVTLYKIDLGLGEEFNKDYVERLMEKLDRANQNLNKVKEDIEVRKRNYEEMISDHEQTINEYRAAIKSLTQLNEDFKNCIRDLDAECIVAEMEVKNIISTLIGKKIG